MQEQYLEKRPLLKESEDKTREKEKKKGRNKNSEEEILLNKDIVEGEEQRWNKNEVK